MKKFIVCFLIFILIVLGVELFKSQQTVECWWGVMYPQLSFIGFENEEQDMSEISSINKDYNFVAKTINNNDSNKIKFKFFIFDWLNKK